MNQSNFTELVIPDGLMLEISNINNFLLDDGQKIIVKGILKIAGDWDNRQLINLNSNSQINVTGTGVLDIQYSHVYYDGILEPIKFELDDYRTDRTLTISNTTFEYNSNNTLSAFDFDIRVDSFNYSFDIIQNTFINSGIKTNLIHPISGDYLFFVNNNFINSIFNVLGNDDYFCYNNFYNTEINIDLSCNGLNYSFNPQLNPDFTLQWGSPAIDAGDPNIIDPDNTRSDIGAHYFYHQRGDLNYDYAINVIDVVFLVEILLESVNDLNNGQIDADDSNYDLFPANMNGNSTIGADGLAEIVCYIIGNVCSSNLEELSQPIYVSKIMRHKDNPSFVMDISMLNLEPVSTSFFKIKLPTGFTPVSFDLDSHSQNMQIEYRVSDDNKTVGIVLFSFDSFIEPGLGKVLSLGLERTALSREDDFIDDSEFTSIELANSGDGLFQFLEVTSNELGRMASELIFEIPTSYSLSPAYPNPFNPLTTIPFAIPEDCHINISIFNLQGRLVKELLNKFTPAGYHHIQWDGSSSASGTYIIKMESTNFSTTEHITLVK